MSLRLTPDADAEDLREVVRDFLARHGDTETVFRGIGSGGWDREAWRRFAGELGVVGLDVPEERGGAGATFREVAIVAEELGRSLVRLPWFSTAVLGIGVLLHGDAPDLLAELASGEVTATLAHLEGFDGWDPDTVRTVAEPDGADGWRLSGTKTLVVEGDTADVLFVVASIEGAPAIFVVDDGAEGLVRRPLPSLDPTRPLAELLLDGTPAALLVGGARSVVPKVLDRARAALAAEQVGGAAAALDMTVRYAGQRVQFGRPIATFQAVKHRCADMAVQVEAARSAAAWAAAAAADDVGELPVAAATAALVCGHAYTWVAGETVQVHGGIGFTWEHPAHLHVRRAATGAALFGTAATNRDAVLDHLGV
ncbi:acyl-CoA dehydrogenase family protein [Pseudonocardia broussonetiae]|uniref:Acyl-CoA/acyl-ACP dehydrogenase n=1 Tax=Pseudonocardia broussonetiae TaxID=2736640 RepID=A0A6M6JGG6_9PSEU|nr:acyl-CoA dehydrogenase family protein [Pseudonocardia broussonetiae]QJY47118.1 acyl-CoA/acyl-ACP dehydrogenase [Pseudonocardia broussonetiae]